MVRLVLLKDDYVEGRAVDGLRKLVVGGAVVSEGRRELGRDSSEHADRASPCVRVLPRRLVEGLSYIVAGPQCGRVERPVTNGASLGHRQQCVRLDDELRLDDPVKEGVDLRLLAGRLRASMSDEPRRFLEQSA